MRVPTDRRVVDMLEGNNIERFRARRLQAHRRTAARKGETASFGPSSRSLPSGPAAPTAGGLALSLLLMGVGVVALGLAFAGLGVAWGFERITRKGDRS